ncbi:MAG: hypothetical protein WCO00_17410 [Rhodospirillaceae bacterium]
MSRKVHLIIEGILAKRLSQSDCYVRQGGDRYYFFFSGLSESEARIKCTLLTREITARLIGDEAGVAELAGLDLRSVVVRVDADQPPTPATLAAIAPLFNQKETENPLQAPGMARDRDATLRGHLMSLLPLLEAIGRDIKQWRQTALSLKERDQGVARLDGIGQLLRQIEHAFTGLAPENLPRGEDGNGGRAPPRCYRWRRSDNCSMCCRS